MDGSKVLHTVALQDVLSDRTKHLKNKNIVFYIRLVTHAVASCMCDHVQAF